MRKLRVEELYDGFMQGFTAGMCRAVGTPERTASLPNVPTTKELGYPI